MKKNFLISLMLLLGSLATCGGIHPPTVAEMHPLNDRATPRAALPQEIETACGRLAALTLAGQHDLAAESLGAILNRESERMRNGQASSGLTDNATDLFNAMAGDPPYSRLSRQLLDTRDPDPVLRSRLEHYLEARPLRVAARKLREDRTRKFGSVFNRLAPAVSRFFLGGVIPVVETGRAALASLLVMHSFPRTSVRERQALRKYQEFLARHPEAPERDWVEKRVRKYERKVRQELHAEAIEAAEKSLRAGRPEATRLHLDRAERLLPDQARDRDLRARAMKAQSHHDTEIRRSLKASALVGIPMGYESKAEFERLAETILTAPLEQVAREAHGWEERNGHGPLSDEIQFLEAYWHLARGEEDLFFEAMRRIARFDPRYSVMARHARTIIHDSDQNPYAAYQHAVRRDRGQKIRWILLGRHARGALQRNLPRPLEVLLDLPGIAISIATTPLRLLQYRGARNRFGGGVLDAGEHYVRRFPEGAHAEKIHARLEALFRTRGRWGQALTHLRARKNPDPEQIAIYRKELAQRMLAAARMQRRLDVRAAIYRSLIDEYRDTTAAEEARKEFRALVANASPQHIRLSRAFLQQYPKLWGPGQLDLRDELLDGNTDNGEIAEEGITLVGRNIIRIALENHKPILRTVLKDRFARFIALLEERSYRELLTDSREKPQPDPERDLFFERARLGLLANADVRPAARSDAEFLSRKEKHGGVLRRESILPVEVVVQGDLADFGFAAFPRIKLPGKTPDAFLYR